MRILALNLGSSSLKFAVFDMASGRPVVDGLIEQPDSVDRALSQVRDRLRLAGEDAVAAVGHRVAHGGADYPRPVVLDSKVELDIERLAPLAPQHNPPALAAIRAARALWPDVPHVAAFDTAFHTSMPAHSAVYAVPSAWREAGLRRYGFHGLSHQYVMEATARHLGTPAAELRIVSCHLGNGASVCAIDRGRSIDTSMGMSALEGLVMGSRCGDLDPGAFGFLSRTFGLTIDQIERALYAESGMSALSGLGGDLRRIEDEAARGHEPARLALQVYAYRVRKYVGAYAAAMGGCDVVAFTGGVGEHSADMRRRIVDGLQFLGLHLDVDRNRESAPGQFGVLAAHEARSRVKLLIVSAQEQWQIARAAFDLLAAKPASAADAAPAIPVAVSAHHVHLTTEAVQALFGPDHRLAVLHPLSQPGYFAAQETVTIVGERGRLERVRVLGPCRAANQIEISRTEAIRLGIDAPLRLSGHTSDTPSVTLEGPAGRLRSDGVIVAQRHLHLDPADALRLHASDGDRIDVALDTPRATVLRDVVLRVSPGAVLEMHIDTDEANAADVRTSGDGVLVRSLCHARPCGRQPADSHSPRDTDARGA